MRSVREGQGRLSDVQRVTHASALTLPRVDPRSNGNRTGNAPACLKTRKVQIVNPVSRKDGARFGLNAGLGICFR